MQLLILAIIGFAAFQTTSGDALCDQYLKCLEAVKEKAAECPHGQGKRSKDAVASNITECVDAMTKQGELKELIEKKQEEQLKCVADHSKATAADEGKDKKKGKCAKLSSRLATGEALFGVKKGGKKEKKGKENNEKAAKQECFRSLHSLRQECRILQKCCSAANDCTPRRNHAENDQLKAKKKEVKDALKQCKSGEKAEKKAAKKAKKNKKQDAPQQ